MKTSIDNEIYDTMLEPLDWRFSAAIVGLIDYLQYHGIEHKVCDDYLLYNIKDITRERYLEYIEDKYGSDLHHKIIEDILSQNDFSEEQIKTVNDKLSANSIMKKKFKEIKFDGSNKEETLDIINKHRYELICETFRNKSNMYANYCNTNQLFNDSQDYCRLVGYCIDAGKKGKSTGYNFSTNSFVGQDVQEFDFIPFAFIGDRESFFINDNYTLHRLKISNEMLRRKVEIDMSGESKSTDTRQALFKGVIESSDFIDYDVEVIFKDKDKGYFETLYIRKESIDILKQIKDYTVFCKPHEVKKNEWINIQKKITERILNNILVDELIELFLKVKNKDYLVSQLININTLIRGDKEMKDRLKGAFACSKQVVQVLPDNKIESYRQKLTSSIIFKDYDRVCQILLQLSNYSNVEFGFVYDLYDDFEENKDLAYTFINALSKSKENK
jgi:CRISPR-associated protein Cst1